MLAGVVGVQNRRDGLDVRAELVGLGVLALVEGVEVEVLLGGLGAPEAQLVYGLAAVADDGHVVRDCLDLLATLDREPVAAVLTLVADDLAAKGDGDGALRATDLPGEAVGEPVVGLLDLATVLDGLVEQAVAVAHAVAVAGDALMGERVHEARGQAAQSAVAEAGVDLLALDVAQRQAHVGQGLVDHVANAVVDEVVVQQGADQELEREVIDLLLVVLPVALVGGNLDLARLGRNEGRQGLEALGIRAVRHRLADGGGAGRLELLDEVVLPVKDLVHVVLLSRQAGPQVFPGMSSFW